MHTSGLGKRCGIRPDSGEPRHRIRSGACEIRFDRPVLPEFLDELHLRGLQTKHGSADVLLRRYRGDVALNITRREGNVPIIVLR